MQKNETKSNDITSFLIFFFMVIFNIADFLN